MPFTFKLSQRLARMRYLGLLAAAALLAACEQPAKVVAGPTQASVTQVVVSPDPARLQLAQSQQFHAFGRTQAGDSVPVSVLWSATGGAISAAGLYTAGQTSGTYQVTAAQSGGSLAGSASVVIQTVPVASIAVTPATASVVVGQSLQLAATPRDANGNPLTGRVVTWATSNAGVATVSGSGLVSGGVAGAATITATSEGQSGAAAVTVSSIPVASVGVSPATANVSVGGTAQFTATAKDAAGGVLAGRAVTWTSANPAIATVSATGLVTAIAAGTATITAMSEGKSGTATVTVATLPVATVTVSPAAPNIFVGGAVQLTATPKDASGTPLSGRTVTWTTSNSAVATVSASGLVTGVAGGAVTITATSEGKTGSAAVTVNLVPVASVAVTPTTASIQGGQTVQLTATPKDAGGNALSGRVVMWTTSNAAVATVNGSGLVTGGAAGGATITATSEGKNGSAAVTVAAVVGGTVLFQETFTDQNFARRGWYDNTSMATTAAEHIAGSTSALEVHFTPGATSPTWGNAARHLFSATETVYVSYWVKYSANWVGSGQTFHPHEFMFLTNEDAQYAGPSFTHLATYVEHNYQNGGIPVLAMQDGSNIDQSRVGLDLTNVTENRAAAGCNGNTDGYPTGCYGLGGGTYNNEKKFMAAQPYFQPGPGPGYKGDWHFVEAYFQLNSIQNGKGVSDGIVRYWFDGQLVIDHTNVLLRTGAHPNMRFTQFLIGPYIGSGSPVDQTMWVDNLTVATARP